MYVSLRDLFWIRSRIPFELRDSVSHALLRNSETTTAAGAKRATRELLLHEPEATQLALIVVLVELSVEHPDREATLLQCAESLMTRPDRYRLLLREFRRELEKTL